MTIRRLITFASAAALLASAGACNSNGRSSSGTSATSPLGSGSSAASPEGRRGANLPRARGMDAGADVNTGSGTTGSIGGSAAPAGSGSDTSGTAGSGSSSGSSGSSTSGGSSNTSGGGK